VVCHQTPSEDREAISIPDLAERVEKQFRVFSIGEDELTSSHTAIDVIGRVWDEQTGFARHGSSLHARGRDSDILLPTAKHHNVIRGTDRELLHNLRNLARRGEFERRPLDLREVLGQAVEIARAEARLHEVTISLDQPDVELTVDGDPVLLQQVVLNLLQNSIAVTAELEDGSPPKVVVVVAERRADAVRVSVEDPGESISDEVLANLFRPFFSTRDKGARHRSADLDGCHPDGCHP